MTGATFAFLEESPQDLLQDLVTLARRAGAATLEHFRTDLDVEHKDDETPVTAADLAADHVLYDGLSALTPEIPIVTEERAAAGEAPALGRGPCWLVDPLDGTREFVAGRAEYTINIGLVVDGVPVLGLLLQPPAGIAYTGCGPGSAKRWDDDKPPVAISARPAPSAGLVVTHSRSHAKRDDIARFLKNKRVADTIVMGSALKFGLIAEGRADLYPRFGRTMAWDTAAGQAILEAAGGSVRRHDGVRLIYTAANFANPPFVARGREG